MNGTSGYYAKCDKSEKDKYHMISFICGVQKKKKSRLKESSLVVGRREGGLRGWQNGRRRSRNTNFHLSYGCLPFPIFFSALPYLVSQLSLTCPLHSSRRKCPDSLISFLLGKSWCQAAVDLRSEVRINLYPNSYSHVSQKLQSP